MRKATPPTRQPSTLSSIQDALLLLMHPPPPFPPDQAPVRSELCRMRKQAVVPHTTTSPTCKVANADGEKQRHRDSYPRSMQPQPPHTRTARGSRAPIWSHAQSDAAQPAGSPKMYAWKVGCTSAVDGFKKMRSPRASCMSNMGEYIKVS